MENEVNTQDIFPMGHSRNRKNKLTMDTNNSVGFCNCHRSTECRSKKGNKEREKSSLELSKKYNRSVRFQVKEISIQSVELKKR